MAGIRWPPEETELVSAARGMAAAAEFVSDDERSVAADSWSIKSEYGSTLDDEQRHADATEALSTCNFPAAYDSDKDEQDVNEVETSVMGLQSYWDTTYAEDLANFQEHGHPGEIWFGVEVMDIVATWTKNLCISTSRACFVADNGSCKSESSKVAEDLSGWNVLDIGTGNGLLLHELTKQGFSDLTGIDYSEGAIDLAQNLAVREGFSSIRFLVDDILETKLDRRFRLVMDKGTFDAIGLHPDGPIKRHMYWESVGNLVAPGGILVITSCNNTKDEILQEVGDFHERTLSSVEKEAGSQPSFTLQYLDHVKTYPSIMFGGMEGSRVATVAFLSLEGPPPAK